MVGKDGKLFKRDICFLISVLIFLIKFLFCSILERKDDKSYKRDIIVLISFPILVFSNFFSGKYWKRNVPSVGPYKKVNY